MEALQWHPITLTPTAWGEQLQIIGEQMKAIAEPWLLQHCPERLDIMVDIESFGQCIPSMVFVPFDRETGETMPRAGCMLMTLDLDWQMRAGLGCDQSTLQWWLTKTSDDARKALYDLPGSFRITNPEELRDAFSVLHAAWGITARDEHHRVWGKPASYDWPRIAALCSAGGIPMPFHFRTSRCCRTIAEIGSKPTKQERDNWKAANDIVTHDPYDDCRLQAWEVARSLRKEEEQASGGDALPASSIELLRFIRDHEGELTSAKLLRKEYNDDVYRLWCSTLAIPDNSESDILRITEKGKQVLEKLEKGDERLRALLQEEGPVYSNPQGTRKFYPGTVYELKDPDVSDPVVFVGGHPEYGNTCVVMQPLDYHLLMLEWDELGEALP